MRAPFTQLPAEQIERAVQSLRTIGGIYDFIADFVRWDNRDAPPAT